MSRPILHRAAAAALFTAILAAAPAWASPVSFDIDGLVDSADAGNALGVSAGDPASITGSFDASLVAAVGDSEVFFGAGSGNLLSIIIGLLTWTEAMDTGYATGIGPSLQFLDGLLVGIGFSSDIGTNGSLASLAIAGGGWTSDDANLNLASGTFDLDSFAVPAPASLLLLLSGLALLRRRRAASTADALSA